MAKIGRNEPCPCGSGTKVKRCCGPHEGQAALKRKAEAIADLVGLAQLFPRLRPEGAAFAEWAEQVAAVEVGEPPLEHAFALLEPDERARIERDHADEFPDVWRSLVEDVEDEAVAREAVLVGAVVAGVYERMPPDSRRVEWLEASPTEDPCFALAVALEPGDLWSLHESALVAVALGAIDDELNDDAYEMVWDATVVAQAHRLATHWHRERVRELVRRLRAQLPLTGLPGASAALAVACDRFEQDERMASQLLEDLLAASLTRLTLGLAAAA